MGVSTVLWFLGLGGIAVCAWEGEGIGSSQLILFVGDSTAWKWISIRTGRTWITNMDTPFAFPVKETLFLYMGFKGGASGKEPACQCRRYKKRWVRFLGQKDPLEKGTATPSCILVWRIPLTEEPGGLQSIGSQSVRHY